MKILVLGAGVIGVTTAYVLGRQGHEVIVVDKADKVASGASHANAGQLSYSYVDPFPNPAILRKLPGYMLGVDNGIKINQVLQPSFYFWGWQFLRHCMAYRTKKNMDTMLGLARQSMKAMQTLSIELPDGLIPENPNGKIVLVKTKSDMEKYKKSTQIKRDNGFEVDVLSRDECIAIEPALENWQGEFCGGMYAKTDGTIDTLEFCQSLKNESIKRFAVEYKFGHIIKSLVMQNGKILGVVTNYGTLKCDVVVMCLGVGAHQILKTIRQRCNIHPMRGYSLTMPPGAQAFTVNITDPMSKIVFANIGEKIRIAGFLDANVSGNKITSRGEALLSTAMKLWPSAAEYKADNHLWAGDRPMTPSGVPIVRSSTVKGLYYNMGHGSLGLTLAAGSAERIAKLIGQPAH